MFDRAVTSLSALAARVLSSVAPEKAGRITQIVSVGGPGGTGSAVIDPSNPYSAGASLEFSNMDAISILFQVDGPGYYQIYFNPLSPGGLGITNHTGERWTSFLFEGDGIICGLSAYPHLTRSGGDSAKMELLMYDGAPVQPGDTFTAYLAFHFTRAGMCSVALTPNVANPALVEPAGLTSSARSARRIPQSQTAPAWR